MGKVAALVLFVLLGVSQFVQAKDNIVREAEITYNGSETVLNLKSDYSDKFDIVKENDNSVYFDLKDAKLAENFVTDYKGNIGEIGLVAQQIGSKVRIYLKGENLGNIKTVFAVNNGLKPFDYKTIGILLSLIGFGSFLVIKCGSDTMRLSKEAIAIKSPIKTAINLNKQLYELQPKHSRIVRNSMSPIKDAYLDFQYASDVKKTKIAI